MVDVQLIFCADDTDQELCDALANMVAAIVVWKPRKMHLWYHLFAASELHHTFMTGFLVKSNFNIILYKLSVLDLIS